MKDNLPSNIRPQSVLGFIAQLPPLLAGKKALKVLFSSYNSIGRYPTGPFLSGKPGLTILITNGEQDGREDLMLMGVVAATTGLDAMERFNDIAKAEVLNAQASIASTMPDKDLENDFVVIYAGLNGTAEALEFAAKVKARSPKAFLTIVTCTCGLDDDKYPLFIARQELIDALVVSPVCGGRSATGGILDAIIELWPASMPKN